MRLARLDAALNADCRARSTHKLLRLVDLLLLLCTNTIFLATEVSLLALKALVISEFKHGVCRCVLVVYGITFD
jgi:hypothetical protein